MAVPASLWAFQCWFLPCGGFCYSLGSWNHIFGCSDLHCEKEENEFGAVSCLQLGPEPHSGAHKQLIRCFTTQTFFPCLWDLLVMAGTLGTFTLSLVVLVLSDCWAAFAHTWHHEVHWWKLHCRFKCTVGSNTSFPTLYHISGQCHIQTKKILLLLLLSPTQALYTLCVLLSSTRRQKKMVTISST